jgi:Tol biopolymer transport system component
VTQLLAGAGYEFAPSVAPDGKRIAFDGSFPVGGDEAQGIYVVGRRGGDVRHVTVAVTTVLAVSPG